MFNKRKIIKLEETIILLENKLRQLNKDNDRYSEEIVNIKREYSSLGNSIEKRLIEFHKEITDKYFETLTKILQVHTESSIITALAHQVNQKDLNNLKSSLLQPFLESKWNNEKQENGQKILNKGTLIIDERNRLYDEMLQKEKKGENIDKIKEQLSVFDWVIKEIGK